jgi:pyruvate dehydrogenase phosphatase
MLGVFDGHGGGACAELVSGRLFHYIALALASDPVAFVTESLQQSLLSDLVTCPSPGTATVYDQNSFHQIRSHVDRNEKYFMIRFAEKMKVNKLRSVQEKISEAFKQCDSDLSEEIRDNLTSVKSNLLKHFYLSLAVSGCCANVIVIQESGIYVANSGM